MKTPNHSRSGGVALRLALVFALTAVAWAVVVLALRQKAQQKAIQTSTFKANMALLDKTKGDERLKIREEVVEFARNNMEDLIKTLNSEELPMSKRAEAAQALGVLGERAVKAAPSLIKAAEHGDTNLRKKALYALGRMPLDPPKVLPLFTQLLSDKDSAVRYHAAFDLGRVKGTSPESVAALQNACSDRDKKVRQAAVNSLDALGQPAGPGRSKSDAPAPPPPDPQ